MQENDLFFIEEIYENHLKKISSIQFTPREIDIIATLMSGKSAQVISNFLSSLGKPIELQTVNTHISNIKRKIEGSAKVSIIDFIEKSDKYKYVHKYYLGLLIQKEFLKILQDLNILLKTKNINFEIYDLGSEYRGKNHPLIKFLEKSLSYIGESVIINNISKKASVTTAIEAKYNLYKLALVTENSDINIIEKFISEATQGSADKILVIASENNDYISNDIKKVTINNKQNYFLSFLKILEKIFINEEKEINNLYIRFQNRFENIFDQPLTSHINDSITLNEEPALKITSRKFPAYQRYKKRLIIYSLLGFMAFAFIIIFHTDISIPLPEKIYSNHKKKYLVNLPSRNEQFTGREKELTQISENLEKNKLSIISQAISGVGKTQLAAEFAYSSMEKNKYDSILWITAENPVAINNSYREIAKKMDIDIKEIRDSEIKNIVHRTLFKDSNLKLLVILDNVPEYKNIQEYLEKLNKEAPKNSTIHILITSRSQYWVNSPLTIENFTKEEAKDYVSKNLPYETEENIESLVEELHYFPLALSQAVSYIREYTSIRDYLELYKARSHHYLDHFVRNLTESNLEDASNDKYQATLWHTWNIGLSKLNDRAKEVIFISAYLNPDEISFDLFNYMPIEERVNAVRDLRKHSFITITNHGLSFKVHRLLQDVIKLTVAKIDMQVQPNSETESNKWILKAMDIFEDKFYKNYVLIERWDYSRRNLHHINSIIDNAMNYKGEVLKRGLGLYTRLGVYYSIVDRNISDDVVKIWQTIYSKSIDNYKDDSINLFLGLVDANLCLLARHRGDFLSAEKYCAKSINFVQTPISYINTDTFYLLNSIRVVPITKPDIHLQIDCDQAYSYVRYGNYLTAIGKDEDAEKVYTKAVDLVTKHHEDNIARYYLLDAKLNQTKVFLRNLEYDKAEKQLKLLSSSYEDLFPQNHPYTTKSLFNNAIVLYNEGEFDEALALANKVLDLRKKAFSKIHKEIAEIKLLIAKIYLSDRNIEEARGNLEDVTKLFELNYEQSNPIFAYLYFTKSRLYELTGEYKKATEYLNKATELLFSKYGKDTKYIMKDQYSLSEKWNGLDHILDETYLNNCIKQYEKMFGYGDFRSAKYHFFLAKTFEKYGKIDEAKKEYETSIDLLNDSNLKTDSTKIKKVLSSNLKFIEENYSKINSNKI